LLIELTGRSAHPGAGQHFLGQCISGRSTGAWRRYLRFRLNCKRRLDDGSNDETCSIST
jgi:hypothetical protein